MSIELTNLDKINFNQLYIEQKEQTTFKPKSSSDWDKKSVFMNEKVHNSIYNEEFLELLDLKDIETLLDVGCGVGNLSLKLAPKLEKVYALDYSSKMLELLESNAKQKGIENIDLVNKSWDDSWDEIPSCDLVIASRSLEVADMKKALTKLNSKAKKKVVLSYKVGGSFVSEEILDVLNKDIIKKPDYIYLVNILYQMGINAKVDFIRSENKQKKIDSFGDFVDSITWSIGSLNADDIQNLCTYYNEVLIKKEPQEEYVYWAIISWDKRVKLS